MKLNSVFQILISSWCHKHYLGGRFLYNSLLNSHPLLIGYPLVFCFKTGNWISLSRFFMQFHSCFCLSSFFKYNKFWSFFIFLQIGSFSQSFVVLFSQLLPGLPKRLSLQSSMDFQNFIIQNSALFSTLFLPQYVNALKNKEHGYTYILSY